MNDPFNNEDFVVADCYVDFQFTKFIRFFAYHFLFFFTLGPFISPIFMKIENKNFIINMGFWKINAGTIFQAMHWIFLVTAIMLQFLYNDNNDLNSTELVMAVTATFLRCVTIAIRYATTTTSRIS